jgi:hypothetical protein
VFHNQSFLIWPQHPEQQHSNPNFENTMDLAISDELTGEPRQVRTGKSFAELLISTVRIIPRIT